MSFTPLKFTTFGRVGSGPIAGLPYNGTSYLQGVGDSVQFSFTDGSAFNLDSVDLAEYSTGFPNPLTVRFVGYFADGSTVAVNLTTDGVIDGTGPLADFQTFRFQGFDGVTRVEIPTSRWSLDNLVVAIPEPASGTLLALGGLALWCLRRR
jgi:hypothetical protein